MTAHPHVANPKLTAPAAEEDLFSLARRACETRRVHQGERGLFVRSRRWLPRGTATAPATTENGPTWQGPRDAALSYVEADDLPRNAHGGIDPTTLTEAWAAGVRVLLCEGVDLARQAAQAGFQVLYRVPFASEQAGAEDTAAALSALSRAVDGGLPLWGTVAIPRGEPLGLDTLRVMALCRLQLPTVPHVLADFSRLGPRLAQMALGFGADMLFGPIVSQRALRLGANAHNPAMTRQEAITLLRGAGLVPCELLAGDLVQEVTS